MIHPVAPFYSLLVRVNPENPASNDFICDLCTEMPKPTDDGKTYTFTIRDGVKWHESYTLAATKGIGTEPTVKQYRRRKTGNSNNEYIIIVTNKEGCNKRHLRRDMT